MSEYQAFYEMVKKWTVWDYRTQGLKSEVIVDMLISDFIEEMVAANLEKVDVNDVKLLAKEFPIRTNKKNRLNAKVDFLVKVKNDLYLIELKSTNASLKDKQKKRMKDAEKNGVEDLWKFFFQIVDGELTASAKKKYEYTLHRIQKQLGIDSSCIRDCFTNVDSKVHIMYICLRNPSEGENFFDDETQHFYLNELQENVKFMSYIRTRGKQEIWNCLHEILLELDQTAEIFEG